MIVFSRQTCRPQNVGNNRPHSRTLLVMQPNNNDRLTAFDPGQPGWASTRRNIHSLTPIRIIVLPLSPFSMDHRASFITFLHLQRSMASSLFNVLDSPHVQPLSRSSLVFPLVLNPQLYAPYISSPSHRHLFATHDHTSAACSAAIPMLCHLPLVSLSSLLGSLSFSLTPHIHLTILISAR